MKIIAKTSSGYLVEANGVELANAAGYNHPNETPGFRRTDSYNTWAGEFPIGTEIKPTSAHDYLLTLRRNEEKVKSSEAILRALADMLHGALPTTIIPPKQDDASEATP